MVDGQPDLALGIEHAPEVAPGHGKVWSGLNGLEVARLDSQEEVRRGRSAASSGQRECRPKRSPSAPLPNARLRTDHPAGADGSADADQRNCVLIYAVPSSQDMFGNALLPFRATHER